MYRMFILTIILLVTSLSKAETKGVDTASIDADKPVSIDSKKYSYKEGLPILTDMLDGDLHEQWKAVKELEAYGDSLSGTDALKKMLNILKLPVDTREMDVYMEAALKDAPAAKNINNLESLSEAWGFRLDLLKTVVMSGSSDAIEIMKSYISSPSIGLKNIGLTVQENYDSFGHWKLGMKAAKLPPPKFQYPEKESMGLQEYRKLVSEALSSNDLNLLRQIIKSLDKPMLNRDAKQIRGIANTPIFTKLSNAYEKLGESIDDVAVKVLLVKAVAYSGDHKAADFYQEIYKTEKNESVLNEAERMRLDTLPYVEKEIFAADKAYPLK